MKKILLMCLIVIGFSNFSYAAQGILHSVYIERVAVISSWGAHVPGNMEVKIKDGFALPAGVVCDNNHLATLKTVDGFNLMFTLLITAQSKNQPVMLGIANDASLTAYPGRCSIKFVSLLQ